MNKDLPVNDQIAMWAKQAINHRREGYETGVAICLDAIEEIVFGTPDRPIHEMLAQLLDEVA